MESKKTNNPFFQDARNIETYEAYYNRDRMQYFNENPQATEKGFILNKIEAINFKESEKLRMWNLSDDDFYKEFRKDEKTTAKTTWNTDEKVNKQMILRKRPNYLPSEFENPQLTFYKNKLRALSPAIEKKIDQKKSQLLDGRALNLSERYKIADKALNIDNTIRRLKIPELKKYELLAFILNCDKDNARNLMNGTYNSKDRDLSTYFNDLNLNE
jgi:hypothetical protein